MHYFLGTVLVVYPSREESVEYSISNSVQIEKLEISVGITFAAFSNWSSICIDLTHGWRQICNPSPTVGKTKGAGPPTTHAKSSGDRRGKGVLGVTDGDLLCLALVRCEFSCHTLGMNDQYDESEVHSQVEIGSGEISLMLHSRYPPNFSWLFWNKGTQDGRNAGRNLYISTRGTNLMTSAIGANCYSWSMVSLQLLDGGCSTERHRRSAAQKILAN